MKKGLLLSRVNAYWNVLLKQIFQFLNSITSQLIGNGVEGLPNNNCQRNAFFNTILYHSHLNIHKTCPFANEWCYIKVKREIIPLTLKKVGKQIEAYCSLGRSRDGESWKFVCIWKCARRHNRTSPTRPPSWDRATSFVLTGHWLHSGRRLIESFHSCWTRET